MSPFNAFLRALLPSRAANKSRTKRCPRRPLLLEQLEGRELPSNLPTISPIGKQFDNENIPLAVNFTVTDLLAPPSTLSITATSNNTTVVPNSGLSILGSAANRTLVITPANNQV